MPNGGRRPGSGRKKGKKIGPYAATRVKQQARERALTQLDITAERTMLEIARVALANRTGVFKDGKLLPLAEWPADAQSLLEGFEVIIKNTAAGDGHQDLVHKVQLAKKLGALEILAKHFGLLEEKVVHSGGLEIRVTTPW